MPTLIYVLRLRGGYYYVGRTTDIASRYEEHLEGSGSAWTVSHPPVTIERTFTESSPFDEDKTTKELMARHGIDRVRGGSYCQEHLTTAQITALQAELRTAAGTCFTCGKAGHYAVDCRTSISKPKPASRPHDEACYRCGRTGHYIADCYASKDVHGRDIVDDDSEEDSDYDDDDSDDDY